jgi:hypothetical protein
MKNQWGIKAVILISLCMFAWSGWIYAQGPKRDIAWGDATPGYRIWTVSDAGGHMKEGDSFSIEKLSANSGINLVPDVDLKKRWKSEISKVELNETTINQKDFLCGFVNVDTDEHDTDDDGFTKFGHGKWHGFMIKVKKSDELMIIWSARPLANEKPRKEKCSELEIEFHGGRAHANG